MNLLLPAIAAALLAAPLRAAPPGNDFMMGSVVKSDKWKMDRTNNIETFTGNVSFRNPQYFLKSSHAVYNRGTGVWDLDGSVYVQRFFPDSSQVELTCERARYLEKTEEAFLSRGAAQIKMRHHAADGKVLNGRSDSAMAENLKRLMHFEGNFSLSTDNLDMYSRRSLYDDTQRTFLLYESTSAAPGAVRDLPAAIGKREGYDFAIGAESIMFFRDSRDIKFYNRVSGWVKDVPAKDVKKAPPAGIHP